MLRAFQLNKFKKLTVIALLGMLALTYLSSGKRTLIFEYIISIGICLSVYKYYLHRKYLIFAVPAFIVFGAITLYLRSFYAAEMNGVYIDVDNVPWSHGSILGMYFFSLEFAFFETLVLCVSEASSIVELFGGSLSALYVTQFQPLLYVIPRILWTSKPDVFYDLSHAVASIMFDTPLSVRVGIAPSYIGSSWVLGGVIGATAYSSMLGFIAGKADNWYWDGFVKKDVWQHHVYVLAIFSVFVLWRQGGLGFSIISIVTSQIGYILLLLATIISATVNRKKLKSK